MKRKDILILAAQFEMDCENLDGASIYQLYFELPKEVQREINQRKILWRIKNLKRFSPIREGKIGPNGN